MSTNAKVEKFKSTMVEETGRIQVIIQQKLTSYKGFALKETKETDYNKSIGENPRSIRYHKSRMVHEDYQDFLVEGNETRDFEVAGCDGDSTTLQALADKTVDPVDTRGTTVHLGYDEYGRTPKRTAIESDIFDILSILQKMNPGQWIQMNREALIDSAMERYERSVIKDIAENAYMKTSVTHRFVVTEGGRFFNAIPEGVLSIGTLERLADRLYAWDYSNGADTPMIDGRKLIRVYAGRTQVEQAIENRKKVKGFIHMSELYANDPKFGETKIFGDFQFIVNQMPPRGFLRRVATGEYEFVEVYPTKNVVTNGEGIREVPNPDYYNCYTYCNGNKQKLYEMAFITHPDGLERQRFEVPILDKMFSEMGAKYSGFDVKFLNDNLLWGGVKSDGTRHMIVNEDRLKAKMKIVHAYAPFSMFPEKMSAILVQASPDQVEVFSACCDGEDEDFTTAQIGLITSPGVKSSDGGEWSTDSQPIQRDWVGEGAGLIRMSSCELVVAKNDDGTWSQQIVVSVVRVNGFDGEATVKVNTSDGTALGGTNFTDMAEDTLTWEDGCGGVQTVTIDILEDAGNPGLDFSVDLSGVTVAVLPASEAEGCVNTTVTLEADADPDADEACSTC